MAMIKPTTAQGTSGNSSTYANTNGPSQNEEEWDTLWSNHAVACDNQNIGPVKVHTIAFQQGLVEGAPTITVTNKTKQLAEAEDPGLTVVNIGTGLTTNLGHGSEASISICTHRCIWADQNYGQVT